MLNDPEKSHLADLRATDRPQIASWNDGGASVLAKSRRCLKIPAAKHRFAEYT
jgi:hypothetical protein